MAAKESKTDKNTPLMRQYLEMKKKFPDAMLLFRVGDFYETYGSDAVKGAGILGITLTRKSNGSESYTEMAGFPYHALEQYLPRLVRAGQRVAICEQLEDPKAAKGLVKRGITELVTPGVSYNDMVLEVKENNFLCGLHLTGGVNGVSFLDVSTGEFYLAQGDIHDIDKLTDGSYYVKSGDTLIHITSINYAEYFNISSGVTSLNNAHAQDTVYYVLNDASTE